MPEGERNPRTVEPTTLYYCPKCGALDKTDGKLCFHCGTTLIVRGYCPTCECMLRLPVGELCPKHEVELLDPREEELNAPPEVGTADLVLLKSFSSSGEADAARIRLEAEGIPTFLDAERMGSTAFYAVATGGVKLSVPRSLEADARIILTQNWAPVESEADPVQDEWEEMEPEPWENRRRVMKFWILVLLIGPGVVALIGRLLRDYLGG